MTKMMKTKVLGIGAIAKMFTDGTIKADLTQRENDTFRQYILENKYAPITLYFQNVDGVLWLMNYGSEFVTMYNLWNMGIVAQNDIMVSIVILDANTAKNDIESNRVLRYINNINNTLYSIEMNK